MSRAATPAKTQTTARRRRPPLRPQVLDFACRHRGVPHPTVVASVRGTNGTLICSATPRSACAPASSYPSTAPPSTAFSGSWNSRCGACRFGGAGPEIEDEVLCPRKLLHRADQLVAQDAGGCADVGIRGIRRRGARIRRRPPPGAGSRYRRTGGQSTDGRSAKPISAKRRQRMAFDQGRDVAPAPPRSGNGRRDPASTCPADGQGSQRCWGRGRRPAGARVIGPADDGTEGGHEQQESRRGE